MAKYLTAVLLTLTLVGLAAAQWAVPQPGQGGIAPDEEPSPALTHRNPGIPPMECTLEPPWCPPDEEDG